jgi:hypothetical protein
LKSTFLPSVKTLTKNCTWKNLYWEQHPGFLRSKKTSFLSTGSFFQTLGKFNHQTFKKGLIQTNAFRKGLIKKASQLRRKKVYKYKGKK